MAGADGRRRKSGKLGNPDNSKTGRLVAANLRNAPPGRYGDGGGLWLQVMELPNGGRGRSWIYRYSFNGKTREMGLGSFSKVGLSLARQAAKKCWEMVHPVDPEVKPLDPIERRRALRAAAKVEAAKPRATFKQCAQEYIALQRAAWRSRKTGPQWENALATYVYSVFGDVPVDSIETEAVLEVLRPIWKTKTVTAKRIRQRIEAVLDYAKAKGLRDRDNPARWRGQLEYALPKPATVTTVKHFRALPYTKIGDFMRKLRLCDGVPARALEFAVLTNLRIGSVIKAHKDEIDPVKMIWTVPPPHLKHRKGQEPKPLRVPLSPPAMSIVEQMVTDYPSSKYLFPGRVPGQPLSESVTGKVIKRCGYHDLTTTHGFRSTFKDWAHEECEPRPHDDVIEMAMAHTIGDAVEAAYRRGELFDKRRKLMDAWAEYCARGDNVVQLPNRTAS
jgi:integrase